MHNNTRNSLCPAEYQSEGQSVLGTAICHFMIITHRASSVSNEWDFPKTSK